MRTKCSARLAGLLVVGVGAFIAAGCSGGQTVTAPTTTPAPAGFPATTTGSVTVGAAPAAATLAPISGGLSVTVAFR